MTGIVDDLPTELHRERVLPTAEAAKFCGYCAKHFLRIVNAEKGAPRPIRLGKRRYGFKLGELIDWTKLPTAA